LASATNVLGKEVSRGVVLPEWIDNNAHMNVAYYALAFDLAVDALWDRFGMTTDHVRDANSSTFTLESHVTYRRELRQSEPYLITAQVMAFSEKGIHQFQRMYHVEEHYLAATCEWLHLHVDMKTRRVAPWPASILERIRACAIAQGEVIRPHEAGRKMQLNKPLFDTDGPT